jgi:hypothetical protein
VAVRCGALQVPHAAALRSGCHGLDCSQGRVVASLEMSRRRDRAADRDRTADAIPWDGRRDLCPGGPCRPESLAARAYGSVTPRRDLRVATTPLAARRVAGKLISGLTAHRRNHQVSPATFDHRLLTLPVKGPCEPSGAGSDIRTSSLLRRILGRGISGKILVRRLPG